MKKKDFAMLVAGVVGGLLFSLGMCMCLLPEWGLGNEGVAVTGIGLAALLGLAIAAWVTRPKSSKKIHWKTVGKIVYGVVSTLVMGVGMSMIMVLEVMIPGIIVGVVGIVMLLSLIPMCMGLK